MIVDPINEDEVFDRINAALRAEGKVLHRGVRDGTGYDERGRFYTTLGEGGEVRDRDIRLDVWARRHGVLKANEAMVPAHGEERDNA